MRHGWGGEGQVAGGRGPCCLVVLEKEGVGWREDPASLAPFPGSS